MDARQQRGLEIAARFRVRRIIGGWVVPSQSGSGRYNVVMGDTPTCTCPDYEARMAKCKHIFAVEYTSERERNADGSETVTETIRVTETLRRSYRQDWGAYNAAQTHEADHFQILLRDLVSGLPEPPQGRGRPRATIADSVFCAIFKVYSTVSTRRFMSDLRAAHASGYIARMPHQSSVFRYLEDATLTPILRALITRTALPLRAVEVDFAADSTGFTSSRFDSWRQHKYGRPATREHTWVKAHVMCGVRTNVVTAIEIAGPHTHDATQFPALVRATAVHFSIGEVSADKGYSSRRNAEAVASVGGTPYIAYKKDTTAALPIGVWEKMFGLFLDNREAWLAHYHKRSNVESTFSAIKRKFGDSLRTKTDVAMVNEVLCKVLAHNLVVNIHASYALGIAPVFEAQRAVAS